MKQIRITSADIMGALEDPTIPDAVLSDDDKLFVESLSGPLNSPESAMTYVDLLSGLKKGE